MTPETIAYVRRLLPWSLAAACFLAAFVIFSGSELGFVRPSGDWAWSKIIAIVTATTLASITVAIGALWEERPWRRNRD